MLERAFVKIMDMSINVAILVVIILLVRFALKRIPKIFSYCLWLAVLLRLLCPINIDLPIGIAPKVQSLTTAYTTTEELSFKSDPNEVIGNALDKMFSGDFEPQVVAVSKNSVHGPIVIGARYDWWEAIVFYSSFLWLGGCVIMVCAGLYRFWKLKIRIKESFCLKDNIFLSDVIDSPFVIGLLHPKIYIPSNLNDLEWEYIIQHETHHIRRFDHIWKLLSFVALCLHWFNPLVWVAFYVSSRDMEMSCDESVLKKQGWNARADYSELLLRFSTGHTAVFGAPLAFGEGDVPKRILNISKWKIPTKKLLIAASVVCGILIVGFSFTHKNGNYGWNVEVVFDKYPVRERSQIEFEMKEYAGVNFVHNEEGLFAGEGDESKQIFPPLYNLFLADLNGDGRRELCGTTSSGSGIVDIRVVVYDYVDGMTYALQERTHYDYFLSGGNGCMVVNRALYMDTTPCAQGRLVLDGRKLMFIGGGNTISGQRTTPYINLDMLQSLFKSSYETVHSYNASSHLQSSTSTGRSTAVEYYIACNSDILSEYIRYGNSSVIVEHVDMQSNQDVFQYLYVIGEFGLEKYEPYVYYDLNQPEQLFVCTEYRDRGYSDIETYYKAVQSGEAEVHPDTYIVCLDEYRIYRWGDTENLYYNIAE